MDDARGPPRQRLAVAQDFRPHVLCPSRGFAVFRRERLLALGAAQEHRHLLGSGVALGHLAVQAEAGRRGRRNHARDTT